MFFKKRFPFIAQKNSLQCGIACLAMICRFYGQNISTGYIEELCPPNSEGISLLSLSKTASKLGFDTMNVKIGIDDLQKATFPIILHWKGNHFVILYNKDKNNKYYISDPAEGLLKLTKEDFEKNWLHSDFKGIAMIIEPNSEFGKTAVVQESSYSATKVIVNYIKDYKKYIFQISLGLILSCVFQSTLPFLTQSIVDIGIKNKDICIIWLILSGQIIIVIGRTITDFIRSWLILHISLKIDITLVSDFLIKLMKLRINFFESGPIGDLLQRIQDHSRIQNFLTKNTLNTLFSILCLFTFSFILLSYNPIIFTTFVIGTALYYCWNITFLKKRKVIDYKLFKTEAVNQSKTYQILSSMQEIKLQGCETRRRWDWEDTQADLYDLKRESLGLQQKKDAGAIFINETKNLIITVLSATSVISGDITLGTMIAIQYIVGQLNSPVEQLMSLIFSVQDFKISIDRINEIYNKPEEDTDNNLIQKFTGPKNITIHNLNFKYDLYSPVYTLKNISLTIPEGKTTAIVGESGCGKTTLLKMLLGFYHSYAGSVFIAGTNIYEYNLKWYRNQCGIVMQNGYIFSESIARNIAVNDDEINYSQLEVATKIANIYDYIMTLPLKFDTKIGSDGVGLSQGQKQRLLIARAIYKNPDFLFLDEATNALDTITERKISNELIEYFKGKTVVIVAHRLSTIKMADQIIVLDKGEIAEIGKHNDLIQNQGIYYNLVKNQLQ